MVFRYSEHPDFVEDRQKMVEQPNRNPSGLPRFYLIGGINKALFDKEISQKYLYRHRFVQLG